MLTESDLSSIRSNHSGGVVIGLLSHKLTLHGRLLLLDDLLLLVISNRTSS
jgi:hypothetical protein